MDKRYAQVIVLFLFTSILTGYALIDAGTKYEELAWVQDAGRSLRRADNIRYSYTTTLSADNASSVERVDVWGNQLTGEWMAEYYVMDEDGIRRILKTFCDGKRLYRYVDWTGEWEEQGMADISMPSFGTMVSLKYKDGDIAEISHSSKGGATVVAVLLTEKYRKALVAEHYDEAQALYEGYRRVETGAGQQENLELGMERYKQVRVESAGNVYEIDAGGVLRRVEYDLIFYVPEIVTEENGQSMLGEEREVSFRHQIEIKGYNEQGILDAIEQCGSEMQ